MVQLQLPAGIMGEAQPTERTVSVTGQGCSNLALPGMLGARSIQILTQPLAHSLTGTPGCAIAYCIRVSPGKAVTSSSAPLRWANYYYPCQAGVIVELGQPQSTGSKQLSPARFAFKSSSNDGWPRGTSRPYRMGMPELNSSRSNLAAAEQRWNMKRARESK